MPKEVSDEAAAKIAAKMSSIGMLDENEDAVEDVVEDVVEEEVVEDEVVEEKTDDEKTEEVVEEEVVEDKVVEEETDDDKVEEAAVEEPPTLPDNLVRAAIHQGWSQEDIDEFFDASPEKALKTFGNIYTATNSISQQFAEIGRRTIAKNNQKDTEVAEKKVSKKIEADYSAIEKEYGADDPLVNMAKAQDERINMLVEKLEETANVVPAKQQEAQNGIDAAVVTQLDSFFNDAGMTDYFDDFYGDISEDSSWDKLTPGQRANRMAVCVMADEILVGTEMQGRDMELREALKLSHLAVSDPIKESVIRTKITKQLKKRSKSITLKPHSGNKKAAKTGGPKTPAELEAKVSEKLAKIF